MQKTIAKFLVGVALTILLRFLLDLAGVTGPKWAILLVCGALGLLLGDAVFRQWTERPSRLQNE